MSETYAMYKPFQRFLSIVMVLILTLSVTILPVAAACSGQKSVTPRTKMTEFRITSGEGLFYRLGWKKTTVTVKNTGKYPVNMYMRNNAGLYCGSWRLQPGETVPLSLKGSGTAIKLLFQCVSQKTTVSVSVNAGSVR